jgi:glucose/arabinose dehydrogenase
MSYIDLVIRRIARPVVLCVVVLVGASCSSRATTSRTTPGPSTAPPSTATASASPSGSSAPAFDPAQVLVRLRLVTGGLDSPLYATGAGDGSGRVFVPEQGGQIRIVDHGRLLPTPFLDLSSKVVSGGEQGLLGLAFHPDYADDGRFYVDYTDLQGDTVVAEYRRSANDPDRADPSSARTILGVDQPFSNHNGGDVVFGPDRDLYVALGDGGSGGDPEGNGQSLDALLGKVLRIDVDHPAGGRPYGIPADNPFVDRSGARPEIWAYGLRNPWRLSFDRATDDLWIGDVGQSAFEEIDHAPAGRGGQNYGWNTMEGPACFEPSSGCDRSGLTLPVASYRHEGGNCTVIGGYVYRGSDFPALRGGYLYADFCTGLIWALNAAASSPHPVRVLDTNFLISSFGEDDEGEMYVTSLGSGQLFQVTASRR